MDYRCVSVRREFEAAPEALFDAWVRPESLAAWMGPHGAAGVEAYVDARKGGRFEIVKRGADGRKVLFAGVFEAIERPRRLVFSWLSPRTRRTRALVSVEFRARARTTEVVVVTSSLRGRALPGLPGTTHSLCASS